MKKSVLIGLAALVTATGLWSPSYAGSRYEDDEEWRRNRHEERWDDRDDDRDVRRDWNEGDDWRWRDRRHWRHHWRHGHRPHWRDYCFVKKVRLYDDWGNVYIKRVRVCR